MDFGIWVSGKAAKTTYLKTILLALAILVTCVGLAGAFYQLPFSFLTVQISYLGGYVDNPIGAVIFSAGFICAGLLIAPHAVYLYQVLLPDVKWMGRLSAVFFFIAGMGIVMVGIFPFDFIYALHITGAIMPFGGVSVSCLCSLFPVGKKLRRKANWPRLWQVLVVFGELFAIMIVAAVLAGIPVIQELQAGTFSSGNPPAAWALCEWLLLFSAIIWAVGIIVISPKNLP